MMDLTDQSRVGGWGRGRPTDTHVLLNVRISCSQDFVMVDEVMEQSHLVVRTISWNTSLWTLMLMTRGGRCISDHISCLFAVSEPNVTTDRFLDNKNTYRCELGNIWLQKHQQTRRLSEFVKLVCRTVSSAVVLSQSDLWPLHFPVEVFCQSDF